MAYSEELLEGALKPLGSAVLDAEDLSAAAVHGEYLCFRRVQVKRLMFYVSVATVGASTVEFNRRPTAGSAAGEVALDTLTIPAGTAAGSIIYKDIDPVELQAGDGLSFEVTAAATSGNGHYGFDADLLPEYVANESDMTASA